MILLLLIEIKLIILKDFEKLIIILNDKWIYIIEANVYINNQN